MPVGFKASRKIDTCPERNNKNHVWIYSHFDETLKQWSKCKYCGQTKFKQLRR